MGAYQSHDELEELADLFYFGHKRRVGEKVAPSVVIKCPAGKPVRRRWGIHTR